MKELLYIQELIEDITDAKPKIDLLMDNQSAMHIMKYGTLNKRSKHIDVRYKYISEKVRENNIKITYCPSNDQLADVLTKPLKNIKFKKLINEIANFKAEKYCKP